MFQNDFLPPIIIVVVVVLPVTARGESPDSLHHHIDYKHQHDDVEEASQAKHGKGRDNATSEEWHAIAVRRDEWGRAVIVVIPDSRA